MYYVYIMSNLYNTVLYVGVTNNLIRRVYEHKHHLDSKSFTARYNVTKLVYYESVENPESAIYREKQLKNKSRKAKEKLIDRMNPQRRDLYDEII